MITKKTLSFALVALCAAASISAMSNQNKPKPGLLRRTATLPFRATWGATKMAGRFTRSRPVLALAALATYPILEKTIFSAVPQTDWRTLVSHLGNTWQNNWAQVKSHLNTLCDAKEGKVVVSTAKTGWETTQNFYRQNIATPIAQSYDTLTDYAPLVGTVGQYLMTNKDAYFVDPNKTFKLRFANGRGAATEDEKLYEQVENMLNRKFYG